MWELGDMSSGNDEGFSRKNKRGCCVNQGTWNQTPGLGRRITEAQADRAGSPHPVSASRKTQAVNSLKGWVVSSESTAWEETGVLTTVTPYPIHPGTKKQTKGVILFHKHEVQCIKSLLAEGSQRPSIGHRIQF